MKKILTLTAEALLLMSLNLQAQPPQGGRPGGRPNGRPGGRPDREEFKMPEVLADTVCLSTLGSIVLMVAPLLETIFFTT